METIALNTPRFVAARNGQELRHSGHVAMEGGVEAGHLRRVGIASPEILDQPQRCGQVVGVKGAHAPQFGQQGGVDRLRFAVARPAVNDAMADRPDGPHVALALEQVGQQRNARQVVGRVARPLLALVGDHIGDGDLPAPQPDALELTHHLARRFSVLAEEREFQARGAGVDRQDETVVHAPSVAGGVGSLTLAASGKRRCCHGSVAWTAQVNWRKSS